MLIESRMCFLKQMFPYLIIYVLFVGLKCCHCHFDLYVNATETEKLLGYRGQFYFVQEGVVKVNAVRFPIDIPTDVNHLCFTWRATNFESKLFYQYKMTSNDSDLLEIQQFKDHGKIHKQEKDVCLPVQCTNKKTGVVKLGIRLNVTGFSKKNITNLLFVRTKSCDKVLVNTIQHITNDVSQSKSEVVVYITTGIACSMIFLMAVGVAVLHIQSTPKPKKDKDRENRRPAFPPPPQRPIIRQGVADNRPGNMTVPVLRHAYLPPDRLGAHIPANIVLPKIEAVQDETTTVGNQIPMDPLHPEDIVPLREMRNKKVQQKLQDILIDRSRVSLDEVVQSGTFGKIYKGIVTATEESEEQNVLVKTVSENASEEQANLLLAEGSMLKGLNHQNICSIIYTCFEDNEVDRPLVIVPTMNQGNLKNFLKKSRTPEGTGLEKSVTTRDLIDMALQIANGMLYLEMRSIVHKDLATRNCLIDDEFHIKISDCALSRDLFPMDYHCLGDNENKPVKWMSVESLEQHRFTTSSDVWSFGVTLWELITLGQQPYASIDAFEMAFYLKNGHRLGQPTGCPDDLFTIMGYCWALSGEERPSFCQLIILLTKFFNALIQFI